MKNWFKKHSNNKKIEDNTPWQLDNVYKRNKESPYTFYKPSKAVTDKLKAGDLVKLIFFRDSDTNEFNFLLKDKPNEPNDSGWVIFSGYEEDEFTSNPDNFQIVALGVVLNVDDSILAFINESPLCAYERNEFGQFDKIHDYDWETYLSE
ncbi:immunity protein Imm33 domain-containing protein [Priestia aryabhattai]|uniref:immunity protein Imm33 domain-containing protein n=1 Tax=Priestia aryabhattai TaxID=412384 RepID=UPI003D2E4FE4